MKITNLLLLASGLLPFAAAQGPAKAAGVNLGNLFVSEPWMAESRWKSMGGQKCEDCSTCIRTEFSLTKKLGQAKANAVFAQHWQTWFTQEDVNTLKKLKINAVRIPVGWWIIEPLVDRKKEFYPQGGLWQLKRVLKMLKAAKIWVMLDIHALPGVHANKQMFAGQCTSDMQFYTKPNYARGLQLSATLAALIHADPDWSMVYQLQAINEPDQNPINTPGLDTYYRSFVDVVRATEVYLGMGCPGKDATRAVPSLDAPTKSLIQRTLKSLRLSPTYYDKPSRSAVAQKGYNSCVTTVFQSASWQWRDPDRYNPAKAVNGPAAFDDHPYFSWGYVAANQTEAAYMEKIYWDRIKDNASRGNTPLISGEYWLAPEDNMKVSTTFLKNFGDAQKLTYSSSGGQYFWNFKIEKGSIVGKMGGKEKNPAGGILRDYVQSVNSGLLHPDATQVFDPNVCDKWRKSNGRRDVHRRHHGEH